MTQLWRGLMTNWIQIHLALNHIPIIGGIFSVPLLFLGLISKNEGIKQLSLFFSFMCAAAAVPAYYSGEWSEALAGAISAIEDNNLVSHHESAKTSTLFALFLALGSGLSFMLYSRFKKHSNIILIANILLASIVATHMAYTGHLGGLLRHPELKNPPTPLPEDQHRHQHDVESQEKETHEEKIEENQHRSEHSH